MLIFHPANSVFAGYSPCWAGGMELFKKRFRELEKQAEDLEASATTRWNSWNEQQQRNIEYPALLNWKVKAKHLIEMSCGTDSQHLKLFTANEKSSYSTSLDILQRLRQVFAAAREDYEGGYLHQVRSLVQAEVFDSELEQAKELLKSGYTVPAAVVAGTFLETTVRSLCTKHGVEFGKLDKMNANLTKAGVYNMLQQKQVTALAAIRNCAAHGNKEEFARADVAGMIADIERFVVRHIV